VAQPGIPGTGNRVAKLAFDGLQQICGVQQVGYEIKANAIEEIVQAGQLRDAGGLVDGLIIGSHPRSHTIRCGLHDGGTTDASRGGGLSEGPCGRQCRRN
jgi:hypothetical protein